MRWWQFALLGAGGGSIVEVLAIYKCISDVAAARRTKTGTVRRKPPGLRAYLDVPVHVWLTILRAVLGASAAGLFGITHQINGVFVAVTLGFSAPSVLGQLGKFPQVADAVKGENERGTSPVSMVVPPDREPAEGVTQ